MRTTRTRRSATPTAPTPAAPTAAPTAATARAAARSPRARRARLVVVAAVVAAHLVVLYSPRAPSTGSGIRLDLVVHVAVFAAVALALRWAGARTVPVTIVLVVEALLSETVQALWLRGRTGDLGDLVADAVGVVAGLGAWAVLAPRSARARPARSPRGPARRPA